jgi:beta-phosphoglucomutase
MGTIKAIIFDMDGVLIDAKEWHYHALNRALELFGFSISRHDHLVTYDGLPTKKKLEMLSLEAGLPVSLHAFVNEMKQRYTTEQINVNCKPKFNHQYALSRLRRDGFRLAVASNSIRLTVDLMLEKAALNSYFEFTLSNEDVLRPKPDPSIYLSCFERLSLHPTECLIIEDNENGIKAAEASGGHLLKVSDVTQVNYLNIVTRLKEIGN